MKLLSLVLGTLITTSLSHSTGVDTCENIPNHGNWFSGCSATECTSPSFMITVRNTGRQIYSYEPNTNYTVSLSGISAGGTVCTPSTCFRGFILNVGVGNHTASTFSSLASFSQNAGILTRLPNEVAVRPMTSCYNGLTHNASVFRPNINALWLSPPSGTGLITFKAILVASRTTSNFIAQTVLSEHIPSQTASATRSPDSSYAISFSSSRSMDMTPSTTSSNTVSSSYTRSSTRSIDATPTTTPTESRSPDATATTTPTETRSSDSTQIPITTTNSITRSPDATSMPTSSITRTPDSTPGETQSSTPTVHPTSSITSSVEPTPSETPTSSRSADETFIPIILSATRTSDGTPHSSPSIDITPTSTLTTASNSIVDAYTPSPPQESTNSFGYIGLGFGVSMIVLVGVLVSYHYIKKSNKQKIILAYTRNQLERERMNYVSRNPIQNTVEPNKQRRLSRTFSVSSTSLASTKMSFEPLTHYA